ncbi:hypothetical protein KL909_004712 [Ogataea angusta]|nr:hypothetical protein KL909_004712 [Ogataea angusta]
MSMTRVIKRSFSGMSKGIKHLVSISDLTTPEFTSLVSRAAHHKSIFKSGLPVSPDISDALKGKLVAMLFSKRSTRTRISTEGAAVYFGGHPMFLGKDDIQLGVNESFYDTTRIVSSMTSCIFARVNSHSEIQQLCEHSSVPIINSLCDTYHPLQAICDILTIKEAFGKTKGLKLAWVGDANNVINDLAVAALRSGINVSVAVPRGIEMNPTIVDVAKTVAQETGASFEVTNDPKHACTDANVIVTDTFVSMGEEAQKQKKLQQFSGFQVNSELTKLAAPNWKFMHCLPRHQEEVTDEVFYSDNSIVFEEGENRLYAAMAAIEAFVIRKELA